MERPRRPDWSWLRSSPLLLGAIVAIIASARVSLAADRGSEVGAVLAVLGAVLLGAWITMLASHNYSGRDDPPEKDESP